MSTPDVLASLRLTEPAREQIRKWLEDERYASERPALEALIDRAHAGEASALDELEDAFSGPLPIGTGGRRGACGPGPNRMNVPVLLETVQGLAEAMFAEGVAPKVAVVYDTRRDSPRFAQVVADALVGFGIDVLLLDAPRPTPMLSYVMRQRGCGAGIVLTASHNPPTDNGIKVYGPDGAQVLGARDRALMEAITRAIAGAAASRPTDTARTGRIERVTPAAGLPELDAAYRAHVLAQGVSPRPADGYRVVFTPLHGVGVPTIPQILERRGFDVRVVQSQLPDGGAFATVRSANPESPEAFAEAVEVARASKADLVIATDPDGDRIGALARNAQGELEFIDGNRLSVMMLDHVLAHANAPKDGWVLTTLVSSPLLGLLGRAAGLEVVEDLLVGFKHHAGMVAEQPERPVVFATEESHGFLRGNEVRDKDGAIAALLLAEAAVEAHRRGETLFDQLADVWRRHGYHREKTANIFAYGVAGRRAIVGLMDAWREDPPATFGGLRVTAVEDRKKPRHTGSPTRDLPGNVLSFTLEAPDGIGCRLVLRPSGTEPKVKVYALVWQRGSASGLAEVRARVDALTETILQDAEQQAQSTMAASFS